LVLAEPVPAGGPRTWPSWRDWPRAAMLDPFCLEHGKRPGRRPSAQHADRRQRGRVRPFAFWL